MSDTPFILNFDLLKAFIQDQKLLKIQFHISLFA